MATTIDKLDISVYNLYAMRTRMIEQINQQLRLDQASTIQAQISIVDAYPKLSEIDLLLGVAPAVTSFAYFFAPPNFRKKRSSPFGISRLLPSLGNEEEQDDLERRAASVECADEEEEAEKSAIMGCFAEISRINSWLGYILGHRGQFLQG